MPVPVVYWPDCTDASSVYPAKRAKAGVRIVHEVYVDLQYAPDGGP